MPRWEVGSARLRATFDVQSDDLQRRDRESRYCQGVSRASIFFIFIGLYFLCEADMAYGFLFVISQSGPVSHPPSRGV